MRTTVTIDDDLAALLEEFRKREGLSFKAALNQIIRIGVQAQSAPPKATSYRTPTRVMGLKPGIDNTRLNTLVDELETDSFTGEDR